MHSALLGYSKDNNGRMPDTDHIGYHPRNNLQQLPDSRQIHYKLYRYVGKNWAIFRCPADKMIPRMTGGNFDGSDPNTSMCDWALYGSSYQWRLFSLAQQKAYDAAGKPWPITNPINWQLVSFYPKTSRLGIARDAVPFHRSRLKQVSSSWTNCSASNMLFLDGHAKLIRGDAWGSTTDLDARF